ncbi:RDD family protein [Mangrovivirga sp. M17]|uniref:RDD family protein n=1 Tax=Mangrovivirga halotolerans TaxID=2993936 RepID=A0ABT3RQZ1_9BACT|nr:RDD family protein [Mangrovivirga halotolerans]MCX2743605.1 RDD family protein [Mangrovivirga halotolerans]
MSNEKITLHRGLAELKPNLSARFWAMFVDLFLFYGLSIAGLFLIGQKSITSFEISILDCVTMVAVWILYFPVTEFLFGQTIGYKVSGLKVVDTQGKEIDFTKAFTRRLYDLIDFHFTLGVVALITTLFSKNNQRLADMATNTFVIGGESLSCFSCNETFILEPNERLNGHIECPNCQAENEIDPLKMHS